MIFLIHKIIKENTFRDKEQDPTLTQINEVHPVFKNTFGVYCCFNSLVSVSHIDNFPSISITANSFPSEEKLPRVLLSIFS